MTSTTWQEIRALRAAPTGLAATNAGRRRTFAAALRQAEELARAASVVTPAARPLPLFYTLSQAGRAIAAARLSGTGELSKHGLDFRLGGTATAILQGTVSPLDRGRGAFQDVADAVGSPQLCGRAELGALWAANPDLRHVLIPPSAGQWPGVLDSPLGTRPADPSDAAVSDPRATPIATGGMVVARVELPGITGADIARVLADYPSLAGAVALKRGDFGEEIAGPTDQVSRVATPPDGKARVGIANTAPAHMIVAEYWDLQDGLYSLVEVDESQPLRPYPHLVGLAQPAVAGGAAPAPLMLWWALLLGLSSLARYHPAEWTAAIDEDTSTLAVPLEQVLDIAAERVPERILASLDV